LLQNSYFENLIVEFHDLYVFTFMPIFISIGYYLLFDL